MATCESCQPSDGFEIVNPLPGTPVGRVVIPMVRVNAKIDEMKPGMVIDPQFTGALNMTQIKAAILADSAFLAALKAALPAG